MGKDIVEGGLGLGKQGRDMGPGEGRVKVAQAPAGGSCGLRIGPRRGGGSGRKGLGEEVGGVGVSVGEGSAEAGQRLRGKQAGGAGEASEKGEGVGPPVDAPREAGELLPRKRSTCARRLASAPASAFGSAKDCPP